LDRGTYQSLLDQYRYGCVFCDPQPTLTWGRTDNFRVLFDVAPLTAGHLIISSVEHHACSGEVPIQQFPELEAVRTAVKTRIREIWGSVTLYEHGRVGHCLTDGPEHRLCHHYHLHCVPGDHVEVSDQLRKRFQALSLSDYTGIPELFAEYADYLYVETDAGEMWYLVVKGEIERHLLRTMVAQQLGHPQRGDWRRFRDASLLVEGMAALGESAGQFSPFLQISS
jgi:diadenosine tetraphosphate (Ap4A) HIT family hydrolase